MSFAFLRPLAASAVLGAALLAAPAASAQPFDHSIQLRLRGLVVVPDPDATIRPIGGGVDITTNAVPELDLTYFLTENWALELIAATTKHDATARGTAAGDVPLGSVWLLPPTLTLQYHFMPDRKIRPYVGAGLNYTFFYDSHGTGVSDLHYKNNLGYALQAGVDYFLDEHWLVNLDLKKIFLSTKASMSAGPVRVLANVDIDPWIVGFGIGYRF